MNKRDEIKKKIKALLEKTVENGATEAEVLSALNKAKSLMMKNFISEHEITDPYITEKCISKSVERKKSAYDLTIFLGSLGELFDCKHYFTKRYVTFFGFEEDVELCIFFYEFIVKACLKEKDTYTNTPEYKELLHQHNGRSLIASFIRGFMIGLCIKMRDMYSCRKNELTAEAGLMVIQKEKRVDQQFKETGTKVRGVGVSEGQYESRAMLSGLKRGKEIEIVQGIDDCRRDSTLKLI